MQLSSDNAFETLCDRSGNVRVVGAFFSGARSLVTDPKEKAQMDHSTHTRLMDSELNETNLMDAVVYGADDERIGTVSHVHGMGAATQVIVDVGGFLGMGAKPVALTTSQLDFMRDEDGDVHATTAWTKEQIKALPEHHH
jgi:hypothetical protein